MGNGSAEGSKGGGIPGSKKMWMWVGGGCAGILLIGGILFLFGAYKGITCCQEVMEQQQQAYRFAVSFSEDLSNERYDAAYQKTSSEFRSEYSREQFIGEVERNEQLIVGATPEPMGFNRHMGDEEDYWQVEMGFLPEHGPTFLVVKIQMVRKGKGKEAEYRVSGFRAQRRQRDVASEPPAKVVQRFHSRLTDGKDLESARALMTGEFAGEGKKKAFEKFVAANAEVLEAKSVSVETIRYSDGTAALYARHRLEAGGSQMVRYEFRKEKMTWKIAEIDPSATPPAPSPSAEEEEGGGSEASGDERSDAGTKSDATE